MKQMIWSSYDLLDETAKEYYQNSQREILDDDCYEVSDEEWAEEVYRWLDDERSNLNKEVDGIIVVFGNLGLWNGRRQGYQILGSTIADILKSQCDDAEWYGDGYNIRGRMGRDEAERIADKIYNREIDEEGFRRRTRSLYPYVAAVYGWKTRQRKPDKAA